MKSTLRDPVFGTLTWDEESETYSGAAQLGPGRPVSVTLVVHCPDEFGPREFAAFLTSARAQFLRLRSDDGVPRAHAARLFEKAMDKAARSSPGVAALAGRLALLGVEMDNAGITLLRFGAEDLWPRKQVAVTVGGDDQLV